MVPRFGGGDGGGGGSANSNHRPPSPWNPDHEHSHSLRAWTQDFQLWLTLTDFQPHQQAAAIVFRPGGPARDMCRGMTPADLINGGAWNGVAYDPVSCIAAG
eukprot:4324772-Alexandrium_andersonii.AAC.1